MKKKIQTLFKHAVLITLFLTAFSLAPKAQVSVSFQVFYDQLTPYGSWINYPSYGYVWIPTQVPQGFRPYATGGHWVYTEDGWALVSDYDWGWAPFHYGNWFYDQYYGWMWLPDYEWAPAWVTWGEYGNNYCWAPIGPHVSFGISYRPPVYCWTFVPHGYITNVNVSRYYVSHVNNTTVINNITVINNVNTVGGRGYVRGPQPQNVERFTHTSVNPVAIRASSTPGRGNVQSGQLAIYRPAINRSGGNFAPTQVQDYHNLHQNSLPAVNTHIRQETFAAAHTSSPLARPANNTNNNPARTNSNPVHNAPNNNPVHNTPNNNPVRNTPNNNPVRSTPNNSAANHNQPVTAPVHRSDNPSNNNPARNNTPRNTTPRQNNNPQPNNPAIHPQQNHPNTNPQHMPNRQPAQQRAPVNRPVTREQPRAQPPKDDHH